MGAPVFSIAGVCGSLLLFVLLVFLLVRAGFAQGVGEARIPDRHRTDGVETVEIVYVADSPAV